MNEMCKIWLRTLYRNEIEEVEGTISNERCFSRGSFEEEDILMHQENINTLQEYLAVLNDLLKEVE